jgi:hypothetical protein
MEEKQLFDASKFHLQLVLGFFPRVESKASVVLALNTGLLGSLAANLPPRTQFHPKMSIACVVVALVAASYWHLFRSAFPNLKRTTPSLIFFGDVSRLKEGEFMEQFAAQDESAIARDLMSQTWRNSVILSDKFEHLKKAFILMLLSVIPWVLSLMMFTMANPQQSKLFSH